MANASSKTVDASHCAELRVAGLVGALIVGLSFVTLAWAAAQNSHAGAVTGVIEGVAFQDDQHYGHGWACQEGNPGSIAIDIYASHPAGAKPPGTYAIAGTANLDNEPAVDHGVP